MQGRQLEMEFVGHFAFEMSESCELNYVEVKKEERGAKGAPNIASGSRVRLMHTEGAPAFTAKNRYGLPHSIRYDLGQGAAQLIPYLPGLAQSSAPAPVETKEAA